MRLEAFITIHRDEIVRRCDVRRASRATAASALEGGQWIPGLLSHIVGVLRHGDRGQARMVNAAVLHGGELFRHGLPLAEAIHGYADVRESILDLAATSDTAVSSVDARTLNRCVDQAIAAAASEFGHRQLRSGVEAATTRAAERLSSLARALRTSIHTAMIAFQAVKAGNAGVAGSTGTVLHRALMGLDALINRSLAEVRHAQGIERREPIQMSGLIHELVPSATLAAAARGLTLTITPVADGIAVAADRHLLGAAVGDLLQNAFKFTPHRAIVTVMVNADVERVSIEIRNDRGGLPINGVGEPSGPLGGGGSSDEIGNGPGLAFSRWGVEANGGRIAARNLPGAGFVFVVDLPRLPVRSAVAS